MSSPFACAVSASFSYASRTSPLPPRNVCSESRALLSCTDTLWKSRRRYSTDSSLDSPRFSAAPYAAITFQRAPPDVNGFAVITSTPSRTRSSQPRMWSGLPFRTASTTTERLTIPSNSSDAQSFATSPASTSLSTSGASENATTSVSSPASTARLCSPDPPYDCSNVTPLPSSVAWNFGISSSYTSRGVEYAASVSFDFSPPAPLEDDDEPPHDVATIQTASAAKTTSTIRGIRPP